MIPRQTFVRAFEIPCSFHVRVDDHSLEAVGGDILPTLHLHVSESMKCKLGLVPDRFGPLTDLEDVCGFAYSQRSSSQLFVLHHFGVL